MNIKKSNNFIFSLLLISINNIFTLNQIGVFNPTDPVLNGLIWGNWGSRPYEYYWISKIVDVKDKRVIDLGVGLPSQYNWYSYAISTLKPSFFAGIDVDSRIINEQIKSSNYEIIHMSMADIKYPDKSFNVAYCISTFEHIPYEIFIKSIQEAHRVLEDDGLLVITLDEEWDKDQPITRDNGWNDLEQSLINNGLFQRKTRSFGLPEFMDLIKDYFVLAQEDAVIDMETGIIKSKNNSNIYYNRHDKDRSILNSGIMYNSCVSYAVLKKK